MFSFFKKQSKPWPATSENPNTERPISVPDFDYTARAPFGWELSFDGYYDEAEPITTYGQIKWALEELKRRQTRNRYGFIHIANIDSGANAQTVFEGTHKGEDLYWSELLFDEDGFFLYGRPNKKGENTGATAFDDAALVLCSFIRNGGEVADFPHLVRTYEKH